MKPHRRLALDWIDAILCLGGGLLAALALEVSSFGGELLRSMIIAPAALSAPALRRWLFDRPERRVKQTVTATGLATSLLIYAGLLFALLPISCLVTEPGVLRTRAGLEIAVYGGAIVVGAGLIAAGGWLGRQRELEPAGKDRCGQPPAP
jgi:hypothetical protein